MTAPRIVTSCIDFIPVPVWQAWDDRMGADTSPIGSGATEAEAVEDLKEALVELQRHRWRRICEAMNRGTWRGTEAEALAEIERIKAEIAGMEKLQ